MILDNINSHAIEVDDCLRYVLEKTNKDYVTEKRIQAILFLCELNWRQQSLSPDRLINTTFQKIRRGIMSKDINRQLPQICLRYPEFKEGRYKRYNYLTTTISSPNLGDGENIDQATALIEEVLKNVEQNTDQELIDYILSLNNVSRLTSGDKIEVDKI